MDELLRLGEPLDYAQLMDLTLDGLVFRLSRDCWIPVGTRVDPPLRARALGAPMQSGLVASHHSAHWVWWGIGTGPTTLEYTTRSRRRMRGADSPWITYERWVQGADLSYIGGIPVTSPERTLYDLTLLTHESAADRRSALRTLHRLYSQVSTVQKDAFRAYLSRQYRRPHLRSVRSLADEALAPRRSALSVQ